MTGKPLQNHRVPVPPALDMCLTGLHLLQASAGTGKTWTLAVLMVRMILERGLLPRQIVVTTFTRTAAAELRSRIRDRLADVRQKLDRALHLLPQGASTLDAADLAMLAGEDVFLQHLLGQKGPIKAEHWAKGGNQLQLALDTLDECFIGTLDSFCQKLLREFAFDLGDSQALSITASEDDIRHELAHNALRRWHGEQSLEVLQLMLDSKHMPSASDLARQASEAMNSLAVPLAPLDEPARVLEAKKSLEQALHDLKATCVNWNEWTEFFSADQQHCFHGNGRLKNNRHLLPELVAHLQQLISANQCWHLPEHLTHVIGGLTMRSRFNNSGASLESWFEAQSVTQALRALLAAKDTLTIELESLQNQLRHSVIHSVREQFGPTLAQVHETTFALQMRHLARALSEGNAALARTIRHRYPVAMVDEFQDTNGDQDRVVACIYRQPLDAAESVTSTLILVGDPKQAIYGFRGGDIHTYNRAHQDIVRLKGVVHHLNVNQRSVTPLVQALDRFFATNPDLGDAVHYEPVQPSTRPHPALVEHNQHNPEPLRELRMVQKGCPIVQTTWEIRRLLGLAQDGALGFEHGNGQRVPVVPDDIAVLARGNRALDQMQEELDRLCIPHWRVSRASVYASPMAQELAQLMEAMLNPWQQSLLRRVLAGRLGGHTLAGLHALEQNRRTLNQFAERLNHAADTWARKGLLAAWAELAEPDGKHQDQPRFWLNLAGQGARPLAERHLIDLRHLLENLHLQHGQVAGPHHLLAWLQQQILRKPNSDGNQQRPAPAASGVRLMTVHAAKGLEFPIVFVLGMDKADSDHSTLYHFMDDEGHAQLGVEKTKQRTIEQEARIASEGRRVAYVALTRASHRLYLLLNADPQSTNNKKTSAKKTDSPDTAATTPLRHWLDHPSAPTLPVQPLVTQCPNPYQAEGTTALTLQARVRPIKHHRQWLTSSYSMLVKHAHVAAVALADSGDLPDQEHDEGEDDNLLPTKPDADAPIWHCFEGGPNAGNALHKLLEVLDPNHVEKWPEVIERRLREHGLLHMDGTKTQQVAQVADWLHHIIHAQLPDGAQLARLDYGDRLREMDFLLSLSEPDSRKDRWHRIGKALHQWHDGFKPSHVHLPDRYLKGSIDLVYVHQGRFYLADYKSNRLGPSDADYHHDAMVRCMDQHHYWMQALIYQVALHRFLQTRHKNYQPEQHLGGVSYLFLRGMRNGQSQGVLHWRFPLELIEQADAALGKTALA